MVSGDLSSRLDAALTRYRESIAELVPLLIERAVADVRAVLPDAAALVTIGRVYEDGAATLRIIAIHDDTGRTIASTDDSSTWAAVEDTADEVGVEHLDLLFDLTGDSYFGESTVTVTVSP